eukprot:TRINITY_DN22624_c0_g1_i1.p1 TRINITY_DN22624_c0_g1~~TRINITY_DN22624_c0_g1_i1.p1  ORF type:complete len:476 (-),score=102.33 TRINITY_DN22624_c0_g1_i1:98-1525(-)
MAANGGFIPLESFKTKFKFNEGTRQLGMPRHSAGATVQMGWNEAVMAQAQGWGEVQLGRRPHHARPHLAAGGSAPAAELRPDDGLSSQQRASLRVAAHIAATSSTASPSSGLEGRSGSASPAPPTGTSASWMQAARRRSLGASTRLSGAGRCPLASGAAAGLAEAAAGPMRRATVGGAGAEVERLLRGDLAHVPLRCTPRAYVPADVAADDDNEGEWWNGGIGASAGPCSRRTSVASVLAPETLGAASGCGSAVEEASRLKGAWGNLRARLLRSLPPGAGGAGTTLDIGNGVLYAGPVDAQQRPNGDGVLFFADGAHHVGGFVHGRADGSGFYFLPRGIALKGSWSQNRRVGDFLVLGAQGEFWKERYSDAGELIGERTSLAPSKLDAPLVSDFGASDADAPQHLFDAATTCAVCGQRYHLPFAHSTECRRHAGDWIPEADFLDEVGSWSCCHAASKKALGCELGFHKPVLAAAS